MSKTMYFLGTGASCGKRCEDNKIIECILVLAEIPERVSLFRTHY